MVDTIRTRATLFASLFQDGQVGGISAQDVRDLIMSLAPSRQTLTYSASLAWDLAVAPSAKVTLTGNITITLSNGEDGGLGYELAVIQDATGNRTVTLSGCTVIGTPNWATAANGINIVCVTVVGATRYAVVN